VEAAHAFCVGFHLLFHFTDYHTEGNTRMRMLRLATLGTAFAMLTACGGAANVTPNTPTNPSAPQSHATKARVLIHIPPKSAQAAAHTRRPAYVSPSTASINVAVDGGTPVNTPLSSTSPNCTTSGNPPATSCAITIDVPTGGMHSFAFTALDINGATLSTNTLTQTLNAGTTNTLNVTLNGIAAGVNATFNTANLNVEPTSSGIVIAPETSTSALSFQVLPVALDADGNMIVGPGTPSLTVTSASFISGGNNTFTAQSPGEGTITITATNADTTTATANFTIFANTTAPPFTASSFTFSPASPATIPSSPEPLVTVASSTYSGPLSINAFCDPGSMANLSTDTLVTLPVSSASFSFFLTGSTLPNTSCDLDFVDAFSDVIQYQVIITM
jgi:hypothetical protein